MVGKFLRCKSIYEAVKPFYILSKLIGFCCFTLNFKNGRIFLSPSDFLSLFASVALWASISYHNFKMLVVQPDDEHAAAQKFVSLIYRFHAALNPMFTLFSVIYLTVKRAHVSRFLEKVDAFDNALVSLGWKFRASNSRYPVIVVIAIGTLLLSLKTFFIMKFAAQLEYIYWLSIGVLLEVPILLSILSHLLLSGFCISTRLKVLNENFKWLNSNLHREPSWMVAKPTRSEKQMIQNFSKLYKLLIDGVDEINSVFTVPVSFFKQNHVDTDHNYFSDRSCHHRSVGNNNNICLLTNRNIFEAARSVTTRKLSVDDRCMFLYYPHSRLLQHWIQHASRGRHVKSRIIF